MVESFGHTRIPDQSEMGDPWTNPGQIDMASSEMFLPVNREIVSDVLGKLVTPGESILEIGAGLGHLGRLVPESLRGHYLQTDRNPQFAALSTANNGLPALATDIYQLPFVNDEKTTGFDAIVAMDVLDILPQLQVAAKQIAGSMKEGGVFVHFHNRRPNMAELSRRLGESGHVFPYVDSDGGLRRFQIVSSEVYQSAHGSLDNPDACDVVADRPDLLDLLSTREYDTFLKVAKDIAKHAGKEGMKTLSFVQLMHGAARSALEGAGMTVHYAGVARGEKLASRKWVAPLLQQSGMGKDVNVVTKQAGAILFDHEILPGGQVLIRNDLSVLIAEKTARGQD